MPDGPCDDVLWTLEHALAFLERTLQDARQIGPYGRLLGDHERLGHGGSVAGVQNAATRAARPARSNISRRQLAERPLSADRRARIRAPEDLRAEHSDQRYEDEVEHHRLRR